MNDVGWVVYIPILLFWFLDGYYLYQEKRFRKLHDTVRIKKEEEVDFNMNFSPEHPEKLFLGALFSLSTFPIYVALGLISLLIIS